MSGRGRFGVHFELWKSLSGPLITLATIRTTCMTSRRMHPHGCYSVECVVSRWLCTTRLIAAQSKQKTKIDNAQRELIETLSDS